MQEAPSLEEMIQSLESQVKVFAQAKMLLDQIERAKEITLLDLSRGHNVDKLIRNTASELGEFCDAVSSETGEKPRDLKENSAWEAGDVTICALSLFFARGGTIPLLLEILETKLTKWEGNVRRCPPKEEL